MGGTILFNLNTTRDTPKFNETNTFQSTQSIGQKPLENSNQKQNKKFTLQLLNLPPASDESPSTRKGYYTDQTSDDYEIYLLEKRLREMRIEENKLKLQAIAQKC